MVRSLSPHRLADFAAIAAPMACLLAGLLGASVAQQQQQAAQRQSAEAALAVVKARLEGEVGAVASGIAGLAAAIDARGGALDADAFEQLARQALQAHPLIRSLSAAPENVVRWTSPHDGRPDALAEAGPAGGQRLPQVWGPVPLAGGGKALVLQIPVQVDAGRRPWGQLLATLPVDALLQASAVGGAPPLRLALHQPGGAFAAGEAGVPALAPVRVDIGWPGGAWPLAAVPVEGWVRPTLAASPIAQAGLLAGFAAAALLVLLGRALRRVEQHDAALRHAALERRTAEERLQLAGAAFSSSSEAIILMNGRFEVSSVNPAFTEISGYEASEVQGAVPQFLDARHAAGTNAPVIRAALEHGGRWRGEVLSLRRSGERYPTWVTINSVQTGHGDAAQYVAVCSDISVIKQTEQELDRLAHYDILTALPNRLLFRRRLVQVIGTATPESFCALLLLDIDGFKGVNDSFGHHVGDRLLCEIAARLLAGVRGRDTVARLGGDEFAVILTSLSSRDRVVEAASRIIQELQAPFHIDDLVVNVSVSIGIACCPDDGADEVLLTRNADAAMYAAKEGGRSTYRFYQWEMTRAVRDRMLMEQRMRDGLERGHFEVWFQPRVDIASGGLIGAEGLVRWRDPEQGLISPATFIPLAERSPLIFALGRTVIEQVVAHAARWHAAGLPFGKLSMNVATPQIERADLAGELREILSGVALPRHMLEIEVTESLFMADAERARRTLNDIRALGLSIAIDDFGTGYSSLAYLKSLPINHLKIDRAFVRDLPEGANDAAIVRAILSMSRSLGFQVTAEGIETEAQLQFLADEGCEFAQGFLFHKPMPAAEFEALLRRGPTAAPRKVDTDTVAPGP